MRIQPDSTVTLYGGVDIDMTSGVQIAFSSIANQRAYFASKLVQSTVNCTTIKKTGALRLEVAGSVVKNCNYLSFVNPSFDNKVWYARITDYNYVNNECTEISYLIDFWQTFMFDVDFEPCQIERQYVNETDFTKGEANPYDPSIYAFQTDETLPTNKELEEYSYEYTTYNRGTDLNVIDENCYLMHMIPKSIASNYNDARHDLFQLSNVFVMCVTPIDFTAFPDAGLTWQGIIDDILEDGGYYSAPNNGIIWRGITDTYGSRKEAYSILSSIPRPYAIIAIPSGDWEPNVNLQPYDWGCNFAGNKHITTIVDYLTSIDCISSILGIHAMPEKMFRFAMAHMAAESTSGYSENEINIKNAYANKSKVFPTYEPHCRKLFTSPYTFLRLENNSGDVKEYQFERFDDIQNSGSANADIVAVTTLNVEPTVVVAPKKYKKKNDFVSSGTIDVSETYGDVDYTYIKYDPTDVGNVNFDERIEMDTFPQIPFNTDGYLTFLAGQAKAMVGSHTKQVDIDLWINKAQGQLGIASTLANMVGGAVNPLNAIGSTGPYSTFEEHTSNPIGSPGRFHEIKNPGLETGGLSMIGFASSTFGGVSSALNSFSDLAHAQISSSLLKSAHRMYDGGYSKSLDDFYSQSKPAYAKDNYYPGTQGGVMDYLLGQLLDFKLTYVKLRDVFLEKYDEYFKTYGYNYAGMTGIPYALRYVKGQTGNNNLPHWEQVNGKDSTYIRTRDAHVTHNMLPVSVAIEGMLNSGVRFLKGESLTPSSTR